MGLINFTEIFRFAFWTDIKMATAKWAPKRYAYTPERGDMVYGRMHLSGYDPHVTVNLKLGVRIPVWEC